MENILPEPLTKKLGDRLRGVVGDTWVIADADRLLAYESDGLTAYRKTPLAVVLPRDTDEVSRVMGSWQKKMCPWCREVRVRGSPEVRWRMVTPSSSARRA